MSDSATIKSISYDAEKLELRVAFADGRTAIHRAVPSAIHATLSASGQQAAFYVANVSGQFPHT